MTERRKIVQLIALTLAFLSNCGVKEAAFPESPRGAAGTLDLECVRRELDQNLRGSPFLIDGDLHVQTQASAITMSASSHRDDDDSCGPNSEISYRVTATNFSGARHDIQYGAFCAGATRAFKYEELDAAMQTINHDCLRR